MSDAKIVGQFVMGFLASAGEVSSVFERKARNILESNGIEGIDPEGWYSVEKFASSMHQIEEEVGEKTSEQAGIKMIEVVDEITDMSSIEAAISVGQEQQAASYQNFSPEEVGQLRHEKLSNGDDRVAYYGGWPYPEAFTRGIFKGFVQMTNGKSSNDVEMVEPDNDEVFACEIPS